MCLYRLCTKEEINKIKKILEKNKTSEGYYVGYKRFCHYTAIKKIVFACQGTDKPILKNKWLKAKSWREFVYKQIDKIPTTMDSFPYYNGFHVMVEKNDMYYEKVYFRKIRDFGMQHTLGNIPSYCVVCEEIMVPGKKI